MPLTELYHTLRQLITTMKPMERITRQNNFIALLAGLYLSRSVHLSKVAAKIPGLTRLPSKIRRLQRFLDNSAVRVRDWYAPFAQAILQQMGGQELRLIVDGSKVGFGHQLLLISVAYRKRSLPLAWTWVKSSRGHSSTWKQRALLTYVHSLIASNTSVLLVGDSEFGDVAVLKLLEKWGWSYVLHQKGRILVRVSPDCASERLDQLLEKEGQQRWLEGCLLTDKHGHPVNLLAYWKPGEKEPWLLATNLTQAQLVRKAYKRRMWIEGTFGDLKRNGFDLENTHLRHFLRLSRLTLAVMVLYVCLIAIGAKTIKDGLRHLVDRNDRRDHSVYRIGLNLVEWRLYNALPISFCLSFYPSHKTVR